MVDALELAKNLTNPGALPLAKAQQPLNRLLGAQVDDNGVASYCLFPLNPDGYSDNRIDHITIDQGPLTPGAPSPVTLTIWTKDGKSYTASFTVPAGGPSEGGTSTTGGTVNIPLSEGWNTPGHSNHGPLLQGGLNYAGGILAELGVGDTYAQGPAWAYLRLKPAQQPGDEAANPDLYFTFNQHGECGYTTENNGHPRYVFIQSPSDLAHDTAITKAGIREQQNRRDPIYLADTNSVYHGITENAISGEFGCAATEGQKPLYTLFVAADGTEMLYGAKALDPAHPEAFDPSSPSLTWGSLPTTEGTLQGCAHLARKQWDARVDQDGETLGIYNDLGPAGAFADTKVVITATPIDPGLIGRLQPTMCLPIANDDGTCSHFTFHGAPGAFYRFVAIGRMA